MLDCKDLGWVDLNSYLSTPSSVPVILGVIEEASSSR